MSAIVISVVMTASRTDRASDEVKPDSPMTEPKAVTPANRSAAHSGSRKYTAVTSRTTQRHTVPPWQVAVRRAGGAIPSGACWASAAI